MDQYDVLSDVFSTLRLTSALYFRAELSGRFAVEVPAEARRIRFHLVRHGTCRVSMSGQEPVTLAPGDVALIPDGARQILSSDPSPTPVSLAELMAQGAVSDGVLRCGVRRPALRLLRLRREPGPSGSARPAAADRAAAR
ncbi:cupin domain-containing protein [Thalassobaculum litoreum]|uniref:cupin domain-containing protein n=1 Tax=Thalassobaculum litoreum TaxID=420996 RepID=UPI001C06DCC2|nr:cupin domain-containing protein [Thalassobaculum litoreum]